MSPSPDRIQARKGATPAQEQGAGRELPLKPELAWRESFGEAIQRKKEGDNPHMRPGAIPQRMGVLQRKSKEDSLQIDEANSAAEQEADAVAEQVVNTSLQQEATPATSQGKGAATILRDKPTGEGEIEKEENEKAVPPKAPAITPLPPPEEKDKAGFAVDEVMQAKALSGGITTGPELGSKIAASQGNGQPLQGSALEQMQQGLGRDLGDVRIHADGTAAQLNQEVNARAFTVGNDIFFGAGQWQPQTHEGQRLLAHELTHTVQQGGSATAAGKGMQQKRLQREDKDPKPKIPFHIKVDKACNQEQFKALVIQQVFKGSPPDKLIWTLNKETYGPNEDVLIMVQADLVNASRNEAAKGQGMGLDDQGKIAGADKRAEEFLNAPNDALLAEIYRRYYEATKITPGEEITGNAADQGKRDLWNQIRDEVLYQHDYIKKLPEQVARIIKITQDGKPITPAEIEKLFQIAKKIEGMDPTSIIDYASKITGSTTDLDQFSATLDAYILDQAEQKKEEKTRLDVQDKLAGNEDLYTLWKHWKSPYSPPGINKYYGSRGERDINPRWEQAVQTEKARREAALLTALKARGFESIAQFEKYIADFEVSFQKAAVRVVLDILARYEGMLYQEGQRYKDPEEIHKLYGSLEVFRMKNTEAARLRGIGAPASRQENSGNLPNSSYDPNKGKIYMAAADREQKAAIAEIDALKPKNPVLGEDHLPVNRRLNKQALTRATPDTLGPLLQSHIAERVEDIHEARRRLLAEPEMVFEMPKMLPQFFQALGMAQDGLPQQIINDKIERIEDGKTFVAIVLGILAIALAIISFGTAIPWLAAGAVGAGAVLSTYAVIDEYHKYVVKKDLADVGMADDPSIVWLIVAVAGAGLDMGAAVNAVGKLGPAAKAIKAGGTLDDFMQASEAFAKLGANEAKMARAAEAAAKSRQAYLDASAELSKVMGNKLYSFPGSLLDPEAWAPLLKMAKAKVSQAGSTFDQWLAELNAWRLEAKLSKLNPAEVDIARKAYLEAKALAEAMEQATGFVPQMRKNVLALIGSDSRFALELADDELKLIIAKGRLAGMSDDAIRDLIFAGSRVEKRSTGLQVLEQIETYQSVLKTGIPTKFATKAEFEAFATDVKSAFSNAGLKGGEPRVFGSSLTKSTARNVDFSLVYKEADFENMLKAAYGGKLKEAGKAIDISNFSHADFVSLAERISTNPSNFNAVAKGDFAVNFSDGMVRAMAGKKGPESAFGLQKILSDLQAKFPTLDLDDFMIVREGSKFDRQPFMPL